MKKIWELLGRQRKQERAQIEEKYKQALAIVVLKTRRGTTQKKKKAISQYVGLPVGELRPLGKNPSRFWLQGCPKDEIEINYGGAISLILEEYLLKGKMPEERKAELRKFVVRNRIRETGLHCDIYGPKGHSRAEIFPCELLS